MSLIYLLETSSIFFIASIFILGLLVGSFLNVVIHRLPLMMQREWAQQCHELIGTSEPETDELTLSKPRSRCPHCGHAITALENIPVISYLALKGRCKECKASISKRYPLIELFTAVISAVVAWLFGFSIAVVGALLLSWALLALTFIDVDHQLLPDSITLPLLWLGLSFNLFATYTDIIANDYFIILFSRCSGWYQPDFVKTTASGYSYSFWSLSGSSRLAGADMGRHSEYCISELERIKLRWCFGLA